MGKMGGGGAGRIKWIIVTNSPICRLVLRACFLGTASDLFRSTIPAPSRVFVPCMNRFLSFLHSLDILENVPASISVSSLHKEASNEISVGNHMNPWWCALCALFCLFLSVWSSRIHHSNARRPPSSYHKNVLMHTHQQEAGGSSDRHGYGMVCVYVCVHMCALQHRRQNKLETANKHGLVSRSPQSCSGQQELLYYSTSGEARMRGKPHPPRQTSTPHPPRDPPSRHCGWGNTTRGMGMESSPCEARLSTHSRRAITYTSMSRCHVSTARLQLPNHQRIHISKSSPLFRPRYCSENTHAHMATPTHTAPTTQQHPSSSCSPPPPAHLAAAQSKCGAQGPDGRRDARGGQQAYVLVYT
jgi:hypothetical protein